MALKLGRLCFGESATALYCRALHIFQITLCKYKKQFEYTQEKRRLEHY